MDSTKKSNLKDSELLLMLQSSKPATDIFLMFLTHLGPLLFKNAPLPNLSERFSAFLDRSFDILSERFKEPSMFEYTKDELSQLIFVYKTCLDAMEKLLPICEQQDKRWLSLQVQYLSCLDARNSRYYANADGRKVLKWVEEKVNIPDDCHQLVINIYMVLIRNAATNTREDMQNLLDLVEQAKKWRLRSNCTSVKNSYELLTHELGKCALSFMKGSLTKELKLFFIKFTLNEYLTYLENEAACEIANEMCYHALQPKNDLSLDDILECIAPDDKVEQRNIGLVFVKVVLNICDDSVCCDDTDFCSAYIAYLNQKSKQYQKVMIPINSILRICAAKLLLYGCKSRDFKLLIKILEENYDGLLSSPSVFFYKEDQYLHEVYEFPYIDSLANLCSLIGSSLLSTLEPFITEEYHLSAGMLNKVKTMFDDIFQLVHSNPRYIECGDKISKMDFVCNLALAAFALSIRTNIDFQRSTSTVKEIIAMERFEKKKRYIVKCLDQIAKFSKEKGKIQEASEALNLCCEALWVCIKCNMGNLSQARLEKLELETHKKGAQLLTFLRDMSHSKVKEKLIEYLTNWSILFDQSENLLTPILVVKTWVEIECERTSKDKSVDSPTLYNLLDSKLSKRNIWSICQQELLTYVEVRGQYPTFCDKAIQKIKANFLQIAYGLSNSCLQKSQIEEGHASGVVEIDHKTIQCLSEAMWEAIVIMEKNSVKIEAKEGPFNHQICMAYCLHALCNLESDPYFEDIKQRTFGDVKTASAVFESMLYLLYNVFDLLQLKGFLESSHVVYQQLTRIHKLKNFSTHTRFSKMWESRRLSHPLCVLPVDISFIQTYLLDDSSKLEKVVSYIQFLEENKAASLGFQQKISFLLGNSPSDRDIIFQRNITVDEVHEAAYELISTEPVPSHSTFLAGNIFLDLCQRHIANGQLSKALSSAKKAQRLHGQLFNRKFAHNVQNQNEENNIKFDYSKIAMEIFEFDSISSDLGDTYLSPWKILQCYLESTLQVAIIFEKVGNGTEAEVHLLRGEKISRFLKLPLFLVAFSSLLGKIYAQLRLKSGAAKLKLARRNISDGHCCSVCNLLLDVTLDEYVGEMHEITSMEEARKFYEDALGKLDMPKWKNSFGCPDIATEDSTCTCSTAVARSKRKREEEEETGSSVRVTLDQCPFSRMKCWPSLPNKMVKSGSLSDLIDLKWEFLRRKLYMELLAKLVRSFAKSDELELDVVHGYLLRSIWVMVDRNLFYHTNSPFPPFPLQHFHHLIVKETPGDVFVIERAELIHNICWYCLRSYHHSLPNRNIFTNLSSKKFEDLASWLMRAFILSREVPRVLQKVSKLLAVMYIVSATREQYSLPDSKNLPYWSAYFLQASMGTDLTCGFLSRLPGRHEGPNVSGSSCIQKDTLDLLRLPTTTADLEKHMKDFLDDLPSTTVVCISLLGCDYNSLLLELLLSHKSVVQAWILVSRLSAKREPIVMLLPVNSILPAYELGIDQDDFEKYWKQPIDDWCCPWGSMVVDDIAPAFNTIFKEHHLAGIPLVKDTVQAWNLKNKWSAILDERLKGLLRKIEDLWFGPWKFLLLGELVNCKNFDSVVKKIGKDLRSKFNSEVNEGLLEIILGGSKYVYDKETLVSNLCLEKECYIAKVGRCDEAMSWILSGAANESGELSKDDFQLLNEALNSLEVDDSIQRAPITLVLDYEVQMLPWESFPVLSNQEVYRMPSVSSIHAVLDKSNNTQEQLGHNLVPFPSIDPLNAHYLLNPSGDLLDMQNKLEKYFTDRNLEGSAGSKAVPTMKKLAGILESHDLFLYIGHNNGERYIPSSEILKLKKCAAAILIGCSSCCLTLQGCYAPEGTPLSYLLAGSPFIVGHQWVVTSLDMIAFAKMLVYLMREEMSQKCLQCDLRGLPESDSPNNNNCCHQLKIGNIIVRARKDIKLRIFGDVKTASALFESILYLLYNIFDLLQLMGFMESSHIIYGHLTRVHKLKNFSTDNQFKKMWESRRLSHPLCVLPVNMSFIQKYLLDDSSKLECLEENKAASLGFQQNFSFLLGNSLSDRDIIFQRNITVDEVHEAAYELISTEPVPSHSTFLAGNIFLDLCQRHIANGQLSKALSSAKKAQRLHGQLFNRKFAHNVQNQNEENNIKFDYSKIAMEIFEFDSISSDLGDTYLSPWKILQCYLESTLQVAIIFEKVGNGTEAEVHLLRGEKISRFLKLPLFQVAFSSLLGKIYAQQRLKSGAATLELARRNISDGHCCSVCNLLLDVTLDEYFGEMHEITSMEEARKFYEDALGKLDMPKWKNSFGCPDIATEDSTCTCSTAVARSKRKREEEEETGSSVRVTLDQCPFSRMKCWPSLPNKMVKSGSLSDLIDLKWEFLRRKLYMELLAKLVRSFAKSDELELEVVHGYLLRSIWVMVDRNPFYHTNSPFPPFPLQHFHHLIVKETPGDVFVIERAELIHNICWYCLRCYNHSLPNRNIFTNLSSKKFEDLASWLMRAFILSREVPLVLQKVSKLLAVMYIVSAKREQYSLPDSKYLPYWSAYFLQASMGTDLTCGFLSRLPGRHEGSNVSGSSCIKGDTLDLLSCSRRLPTTTADLEEHMKDFLDDLPSTTVSVVQAWILVSRLSAKREPIVMLLPVNSILPDYELGIDQDDFEKYWKQPIDDWCCPWGSTVVDDIAPAFKTIFKEHHLAGSPLVKDTEQAWNFKNKWTSILDERLKRLLREIEDLWFGPWKFLLLGELVNCKNFDSVVEKIGKDLRSKFNSEINEGLLEIILGGSKYVYDKETLVSNLCLKKECYIAKVGRCDEVMSWILSEAANESGELSKDDLQLLNEALNSLEVDDSTQRAPITLVLDYEVQMLHWESFPVLSNQGVYRMPSVSSIHAVLDKGSSTQEQLGQNLVPFPSIDPLNAYYLLNPSGDLLDMQNSLEKYFTDRNLEGNAGSKAIPTMKKLAAILESHDLFLYIGHNNGEKYIPSSEILKLRKCAAAILIGCKSCCLTLQGCYAPKGTRLSYLLAGSPFIVGHQWVVTSFDMTAYAKMLVYLMREEMSQKCLQCDLRGLPESDSPNNNNCCHQLKIGDIIVRARKVCKSFLNEASIVCYGIPMGIRKKNI